MLQTTGYFGVGGGLAGRQPVLWERMTWKSIQAMHARGERLVALPVGATEQHGPHLPLSTDTAIASAVCGYASALTGVPVLPAISYAVSVGHTQHWPGTVSLTHETLALSIREAYEWIHSAGFDRILIVNSHFGNAATLQVAIDRLRYEYGEKLQIGLVETYFVTDQVKEYFLSDGDDIHANRAETDLMLHIDPDACVMEAVEDDEDRTAGTVFSYVVPRTSRNGVTGRPSLGNADRGAELLEEMGQGLASILETARTEEAPLQWSSQQGNQQGTTQR
ncbi:creatininase family protein [Spiribacter vilamensis]|uniref:Creatinine amidohydrolase n=1 Tax=Spiribacter vilamensis TaxID=531306 RepID=A0A4Q8D1F5_9GAMM|nr:creatininase family protein [Spiribacter vilamensis]RZU99196.1 creatinine amidohydrolase [Spiribacter vilamensis]TVO61816.1 creatininase family protein [Spiribacter vilamensis]